MDSAGITKRGRGRPRKAAKIVNVRKQGIVNLPSNGDTPDPGDVHIVEVIYANPEMFKKITNLFKLMASDYVLIRFEQDRMIFFSNDHFQKSNIHVEIFGRELHLYYCEAPFETVLELASLREVFSGIDKDISMLIIKITRKMKDSHVQFILDRPKLNNDLIYTQEISKAYVPYDLFLEKIDDEPYFIHWSIPFKDLKKDIANYSSVTDTLMVEKEEGKPLTMGYNRSGGKTTHRSVFKNGETIDLCVVNSSYVNISFHLAHVKSYSRAGLTENVKISVHPSKDLIFTCVLDENKGLNKKPIPGSHTCIIRVYTEISKSAHC